MEQFNKLDDFDFDSLLLDSDIASMLQNADVLPEPVANEINIQSQTRERPSSRKHTRDELLGFLSDEEFRDVLMTSFGEIDEENTLKVMRLGSIDRIIQSSLVARKSSTNLIVPPIIGTVYVDHEAIIKSIAEKIMKALRISDMNGLAKLISEDFVDDCYLTTPDLSETAVMKSRVMLYFGLLFETFPDGIWKFQSQQLIVSNMSITIPFSFSGTSVYDNSIDTMFKYINHHVIKRIDEHETGKNQNDCKFVASHMSQYVRFPSFTIPDNIPPVNNNLTLYTNTTSGGNSANHSDGDITDEDSIIRVNSYSKVSVKSLGKDLSVANNSITVHHDEKVSADPSIREIANKALKKGIIKHQRRLEVVFNTSDQVIRLHIV